MNTHLLTFIRQYAVVVLGTLLLVMAVAFLSIPYSLGGTPGEMGTAHANLQNQAQSQAPVTRHMS